MSHSETYTPDYGDETRYATADDPTVILNGLEIIDENDEYDADALFTYAHLQGYSDIHLKTGVPPKMRRNKELLPIEGLRPLTALDTDLFRQQTMSDRDTGLFANQTYHHRYAFDLPGIARFRLIITLAQGGYYIAARRLADTPPTFDQLDTKPAIRDLANLQSGLILVSGVTGSGKSTLMAAIINHINQNRAMNIISLEDPVEIIHPDILASIVQRNVGTDLETFDQGVVDAMRQDPDVILIGEINNRETAKAALAAANTGHLVISTVHAQDTLSSIIRMLEFFSKEEESGMRALISRTLRAVVNQKLLLTADGEHLIPANEILLKTQQVGNLIATAAPDRELDEILENSEDVGMLTYEADLLSMYRQGFITREASEHHAENPERIAALLKKYDEQVANAPAAPQPTFSFPGAPLTPRPAPPVPTPSLAPLTQPVKPFSALIQEAEAKQGIVKPNSSAAPTELKRPPRPRFTL